MKTYSIAVVVSKCNQNRRSEMINVIRYSGKNREDRLIGMTLLSFLTTPLILLAIAAGIIAL
jgi:hypothetical protein